jgi:signal transduction histidine kinase
MRFAVLLALFSFCSIVVEAQNLTLVDSLRGRLKGAPPEQRFQLWNAIGFEYRYSYPDSTIYYCEQAYELGTELALEKELSKPLSFIGLAFANKGDYQQSLQYHHRSIELAQAQEDSVQLAFGYNNLGRMFFDQGDLVRAYDNLIRAKDIFETTGDRSGLAYVNRSLANIFSSQGEYAKALEMSKAAYELRKDLGEPRLVISSLMELGLIQQQAGETEAALQSFLKADSAAVHLNDPTTKAELAIGLAEIYLAQQRFDDAYAEISNLGITLNALTNQKLFLRARFVEAHYHFQKKNNERAISLLREVLTSAESTGNVSFQRDASLLLSEVYMRLKNEAMANEYKNRHRIFSEMLQNSDLSRQIERLQFQLQIEKKERENELLKANEAKNSLMLRQQRFQNLLLILVIVFVVVVALILWMTSRRRRLINHKLALQNSQILKQREEISRQNEVLSHNNHILSDLNQEKNTLMNIVAHDLKSPLNRIKGLSNLTAMEGNLSPSQQEYLKMIQDSTQAGIDMIIDLLDVNALEEITGNAEYSEVDLRDLIDKRTQALRLSASEKNIALRVSSELAGAIQTDPNYVGRIVDNLVSNAIKFSPKGATVYLRSYLQDGYAVLSVKDEGPGFQEADRPFVFQKFKKLSARPTAGESSNGLGLAIVKTLVDRLRGNIELKSEPGKGSEFIVLLPLN